MSSNLVQQWVDMGQASLNALKAMSESNSSAIGNAMHQQFNTADAATLLKALLDANKQLVDMNAAAVTGLLHNQLKLLKLGGSTTAIQDLTTTNTAFVNGFVEKQMAMVTEFTGMYSAYLTDLQGTQTLDDIAQVQSDFFEKLERKVKDNAQGVGQLLLSAKTATTAWTERTLKQAMEGRNEVLASE